MEERKKKSGNMFDVVYVALLAVLLVVAVFYIGKPRVGIISLGRAAEELGVEQKIIEDAQAWRETAAGDFNKLKEEYRAFGKGIQAKAADVETEEEKIALKKDLTQATREYYKSSAEVRSRVRKHQQLVLRTFRSRLDPFIAEVSRKRRLWLVLDRSARLVYATSRIDITDEVVAAAMSTFEMQTSLIDKELPAEEDMPESLIENEDIDVMPEAEGETAE